jgi:predicted TIM-barrel fold metal-dependent hydrolase
MVSRIMSADSHVLEPGDLWTKRVSAKFRDRAPRIIHEHNGQTGDFLLCEPLPPFNITSLGTAGIPVEDQPKFSLGGYSVCRPGGWDAAERIKDMDLDGVDVEIFYCGLGMFFFGYPEDEFQRDLLRAYNDFAYEYASYDPKRLLPVASISMTDVDLAMAEAERCAKLGFKGVFISNDPAPERRYNDPMWEPFWSACEEMDLPVNMHILTGQRGTGLGQSILADYMKLPAYAFTSILEMISAGVLERHPNLKVISVENDIGWIAHFLKRLEHASNRWSARFPEMRMNAADYWRRQVYATFQDDVPGVRTRDLIGVENLMWGSDYPHFDSTFPNSRREIEKNFAGVSEEDRELILGGNMARVYNLDVAVGVAAD